MDPKTTTLTSTNQQIGYSGSDNYLVIKFVPGAALSPSGQGIIDVLMPEWYNIDFGSKIGDMY